MLFEARVIRAAATDSDAFSKLYRHYLQPTYAFIAFRVKGMVEAEDLTSELWMKVLDRLSTLQNPRPEVFRAWLFTMARRLIIDHYRKTKPIASLNEDMEILQEAELNPFLMEEQRIHELVRNLPPQQAEIVSLKYFSGLRNKEIAQLMELSEKTVASHLSRGLQSLKRGLRQFTQ
jgi:RNA polymerase sigma factor (sigma-70 family)